MLVKLANHWFAPSQPNKHDGDRVFSGMFYKRGEHDMPDFLEEFLPTNAVILDKKKTYEAPDIDHTDTLRSLDVARDQADAEAEVHRMAEETRQTGKLPGKVVRK